ncbi:MAG: adenosine-specific kinase [Candidatus Krumholzibacteriota bacterium]|nr:adenosine-specific kinase [Candidatus Krumholzibacteriota bacterium]
MEFLSVSIEKPSDINFILGQSHFIKTVEDIHEAAVGSVPGIKFGVAFCEASGDCLIRYSGNDAEMIELSKKNASSIGAGHSFIIFMRDAFPINLLNAIRLIPEVCGIFCATANQVDVIIAENSRGRGIVGVIDGEKPAGIEDEKGKNWRHELLRKFGYKL